MEVDGESDKREFGWAGGQVSETDKQLQMKRSIFGGRRSEMD
jgi:hypothetical protein